MPYNCKLTDENRYLFEERINELIRVFFMTFSQVVADCIITKMYEYLLSYQYINTNAEVHQRDIFKQKLFSKDGLQLVNIMCTIRNYEVHSPSDLNNKLYRNFRIMITPDSIQDITGFYLSSEAAAKFLQWQSDQVRVEQAAIPSKKMMSF